MAEARAVLDPVQTTGPPSNSPGRQRPGSTGESPGGVEEGALGPRFRDTALLTSPLPTPEPIMGADLRGLATAATYHLDDGAMGTGSGIAAPARAIAHSYYVGTSERH